VAKEYVLPVIARRGEVIDSHQPADPTLQQAARHGKCCDENHQIYVGDFVSAEGKPPPNFGQAQIYEDDEQEHTDSRWGELADGYLDAGDH
jgi:hypothetical protein